MTTDGQTRDRRRIDRSVPEAAPLTAEDWIDLLREHPEFVLRVTDETDAGTFWFWVLEDGTFSFRSRNWTQSQQAIPTDLAAVLSGDVATQLLVEQEADPAGDDDG